MRVASIRQRSSERGATLISTLMLVVALSTVALLGMRTTMRETQSTGGLVARERALMAAQAAADLAAAQYRDDTSTVSSSLVGYGSRSCSDPCGDCIPGDATTRGNTSGFRNHILSDGAKVDCNGRPCMRQGAVVNLAPTGAATPFAWCNTPMRDLVSAGDPEANVTVWIRNNAADALSGVGTWEQDTDGRFVVTASAVVRGVSVTVEQEILVISTDGSSVYGMTSPDLGYGSGHNNDNAAVSVCRDNSVSYGS